MIPFRFLPDLLPEWGKTGSIEKPRSRAEIGRRKAVVKGLGFHNKKTSQWGGQFPCRGFRGGPGRGLFVNPARGGKNFRHPMQCVREPSACMVRDSAQTFGHIFCSNSSRDKISEFQRERWTSQVYARKCFKNGLSTKSKTFAAKKNPRCPGRGQFCCLGLIWGIPHRGWALSLRPSPGHAAPAEPFFKHGGAPPSKLLF